MPILSPKHEYNQPFFRLADTGDGGGGGQPPQERGVKILARHEYFITHLVVIAGCVCGESIHKNQSEYGEKFWR